MMVNAGPVSQCIHGQPIYDSGYTPCAMCGGPQAVVAESPQVAALQAQVEALRAERDEARQEAATLRNGFDYVVEERNAARGDRDGLRRELQKALGRLTAVSAAACAIYSDEEVITYWHPDDTPESLCRLADALHACGLTDEAIAPYVGHAIVGGAAEAGEGGAE